MTFIVESAVTVRREIPKWYLKYSAARSRPTNRLMFHRKSRRRAIGRTRTRARVQTVSRTSRIRFTLVATMITQRIVHFSSIATMLTILAAASPRKRLVSWDFWWNYQKKGTRRKNPKGHNAQFLSFDSEEIFKKFNQFSNQFQSFKWFFKFLGILFIGRYPQPP